MDNEAPSPVPGPGPGRTLGASALRSIAILPCGSGFFPRARVHTSRISSSA